MQCRCGASFCYACGVRWKRCPCPQWDERRLVLAATEEVDRQDRVRGQGRGAPEVAAARGARVAAAADRMREHGHDECAHKWRRLSAGELTTARCERCSYYLPLYGAAAEEQRRLMLSQLLLPAASERLSRVRLVKPAKARQVEDAVLGAARAGRVTGPLDEAALKELLAQFAAVNERKPSITIARRRNFDADDSD
ncbi:hypothetical protein I4F81_003892 [Pyropia yezoensis]|uniref:Uncharacterized protein n=1 Tax=Pyropia yezoensis TaxID=2788 RepID=A0ACC3BTR8_PYRYE|nr:hypothetical protein I4F81_003892 [Neopyropia yezoensis]